MPKKRKDMSVWEWFLELGPLKVTVLINLIGMIVIAICMWVVRWVTYHK